MKNIFKKIASVALSLAAFASVFSFASCKKEETVLANYFQHLPYLEDFNKERGTDLVSVASIHVEPFALYAGKETSLDAIEEGGKTIAVPNDATNEARALLLLEQQGYITLKEGAGILATRLDIAENPYNIQIEEVEAAQLPRIRSTVDYALINANYALADGLNPVKDGLAVEGSYSAYGNIVAVKRGNETDPRVLALVAALKSQQVKDYIADTYQGAVISTVDETTDGYDPSVDYTALDGKSFTVAASATPHAEILEVAKTILAEKGITLKIRVFDDYVQPNIVVNNG